MRNLRIAAVAFVVTFLLMRAITAVAQQAIVMMGTSSGVAKPIAVSSAGSVSIAIQ